MAVNWSGESWERWSIRLKSTVHWVESLDLGPGVGDERRGSIPRGPTPPSSAPLLDPGRAHLPIDTRANGPIVERAHGPNQILASACASAGT
jgi:hypothetical protein